jgi:O-antigen/teichoic acid export membrane protein
MPDTISRRVGTYQTLRHNLRLLRARMGDTVWALVDQGVGVVASMLSFLLLGRTLGASGYGAFVGLYALIGPFLAPSISGVFLAGMEHIVREGEDAVRVARSCLSIAAVNALIWVPALSAVGLHWIDGLPALAAILLVATEFCLNGIFATCQGIVQALTGFAPTARLRIMVALTKIALLTTLAVFGSLTLTTLAVGQVITLGAVALFCAIKISRLIGVPAWPGPIRGRHVRSALLYGLGIAASSVQADGDKFVLNAAHYQADAGRYGAAYRLMSIILMPANALLSATHLSFLQADESADTQLRRAVRLSVVTLIYGVPAVLGLIVFAPLVPKILTREFAETTLILQLLAPVVLLRGVGSFPMNGLMGLGRNAQRTVLLGANALLSLALYILLIPKHSWRGALVATLVSEVSLCASGWVALLLCERRRRTETSPGELVQELPGPRSLR